MAFSFGSTPAAAPAFRRPAAAPAGGLFGAPAAAPAAGGFSFGAPKPAGGGLFGAAPAPAPAGGLFGATPAPAPGGLFGATPAPALRAASSAPESLRSARRRRPRAAASAPGGRRRTRRPRRRPLRQHNDHGLRSSNKQHRCPREPDGADRAAATGLRCGPRGLRSEGGHRRVHGPGPAEPRREARDALLRRRRVAAGGATAPEAAAGVRAPERWAKFSLHNPDPDRCVPQPVVGFQAFATRVERAQQALAKNEELARQVRAKAEVLLRAARLSDGVADELRARNATLQLRLLRVAKKAEVARRENIPVHPEERRLAARLRKLEHDALAPRAALDALSREASRGAPAARAPALPAEDRARLEAALEAQHAGLAAVGRGPRRCAGRGHHGEAPAVGGAPALVAAAGRRPPGDRR